MSLMKLDCEGNAQVKSSRVVVVMGKLVRTIVIIIITFMLASLVLYRVRLGHGARPSEHPRPLASAIIETEGQVSEVDSDDGRLVLTDGDQNIVVIFDERTSITQSGGAVAASAITPGARATVRYTPQNGKNRARSISLTARR
ncbi:MAG TPA: hypothetical protein VGV87_11500 [Blastocatellia bacterium]|jgi:hypothetical protein|nr:hypothetical protein [Blastocatellia bacterium]